MNPNDIVLKVVGALDRSQIPYMVVGSFSSNVHGVERNTKDADLVLQLESQPIGTLIQELGPDFSFDPQLGFETVTMTRRYIVSHRDACAQHSDRREAVGRPEVICICV